MHCLLYLNVECLSPWLLALSYAIWEVGNGPTADRRSYYYSSQSTEEYLWYLYSKGRDSILGNPFSVKRDTERCNWSLCDFSQVRRPDAPGKLVMHRSCLCPIGYQWGISSSSSSRGGVEDLGRILKSAPFSGSALLLSFRSAFFSRVVYRGAGLVLYEAQSKHGKGGGGGG